MKFNMVATQVPYRQHLEPIWEALGSDEQGVFVGRVNGVLHVKPADVWVTAAYRDFQRVYPLRGKTVLMEHGCGLQWFAPHVLDRVRRADLIAAPNAFVGDRYAALGAHVEIVGTPKMDALMGIPAPRQGTVAVSFHWTSLRQRTTVLELYRDALEKLAANHHVIGHAHPRVFVEVAKFWASLGIEAVQDFTEVVRRADVYCCEHSSTLYEWAALGRPVVLLHSPAGRRVVPQASGLRYDSHAHIGQTARPETLLSAVGLALVGDGCERARAAARVELYPYLGRSTARMIDALHEMEEP